MKIKIILILLGGLPLSLGAQNCQHFSDLIRQAQNLEKQANAPSYQEAVNKYFAAMLDCPEKAKEAKIGIEKIFQIVNQLKIDAEKAKEDAERQNNM
ncbi:MAG: hypothetical protein AAFU64_01375, partial [Bacteroidota bacterium]